jgi:hypothetical protein
LQATLVSQLKSKGLEPNAQSGLLRAIRLCERFKNHSRGSQAELLVLLKEVKNLFNPDNPGKVVSCYGDIREGRGRAFVAIGLSKARRSLGLDGRFIDHHLLTRPGTTGLNSGFL